MASRKASTDKPTSNLEADFKDTSTTTTTVTETPYPASNTGFLTNEKTTDVLNYYAISLGIGGFANINGNGSLKVSYIRQLHSNFLGWLVANNIVTVNDDMVNYIKAYLSTFNNNSVV